MPPISTFSQPHLQSICDVLADTSDGLTGTEIFHILRGLEIDDPSPSLSKRHLLFTALSTRQNRDRCGTLVVAFIHAAMEPVRYHTHLRYTSLSSRQNRLPVALAGHGLGVLLGEWHEARCTPENPNCQCGSVLFPVGWLMIHACTGFLPTEHRLP